MIFDLLAHAKISYFEYFVVDEDVVRFDIPMNQFSIVEHLITFAYLLHYIPYLLLRHQCHFRNKCLQRTLITIFHDNVEIITTLNLSLDAIN